MSRLFEAARISQNKQLFIKFPGKQRTAPQLEVT